MNSGSLSQLELSRNGRRALFMLFAAGLLLRFGAVLWGSVYYNESQVNFHPDEPKLVRYMDDFPASWSENHDYRYPTFVHNVYGALWMPIRNGLGWNDPEPSDSEGGKAAYERALIFGRTLSVLFFGLGGMVLLWRFGRRAFGATAGLFAVALSNVMPWTIVSTPLVQPDVPAAVTLLLFFYLLLRLEDRVSLRPRDGWLPGLALGAAIAMKYPAGIGVLGGLLFAFWAVRRGRARAGAALGFVAVATLTSIVAFCVFVPGVIFDFENFRSSIEYEFRNASTTDWSLQRTLKQLSLGIPLIGLSVAAIGFGGYLKNRKSMTPLLAALSMAAYFAISFRSFKADYAIPLYPWVALFGGVALAHLASILPSRLRSVLLVPLLLVAHLWCGYVVQQRYVSDTRYRFQAWLEEHIPAGPLGEGPFPGNRRPSFNAREPVGYEFVGVHGKPEWIVLSQRGYFKLTQILNDPERFPQYPLIPGDRQLAGLTERDFLFYEDLLYGMQREFKYERVTIFEPRTDLPLDKMGKVIQVWRKIPEDKIPE